MLRLLPASPPLPLNRDLHHLPSSLLCTTTTSSSSSRIPLAAHLSTCTTSSTATPLSAIPMSPSCIALLVTTAGLLPSDLPPLLSRLSYLPSPSLLSSALLFLHRHLPPPVLRLSLQRCPRLLLLSPDSLSSSLFFLTCLRIPLTARTSPILAQSPERSLLPKIRALTQQLSLPEAEVKEMVRRSPGIIMCNLERNLGPKLEFLVSEIGLERARKELKEFPQFFSFSLDGRIKPRLRAVKGCNVELPLKETLSLSDGEFRECIFELRIRAMDPSFTL